MARWLQRVGSFAVRRRRAVLAAWMLGLVALGVLAGTFKGTFSNEFKVPGTESQAAIELIQRSVPQANANGATGRVVFASSTAVDRAAVNAAVKQLGAVPGVASAGAPVVSADGRIAYTDLQFSLVQADVG